MEIKIYNRIFKVAFSIQNIHSFKNQLYLIYDIFEFIL